MDRELGIQIDVKAIPFVSFAMAHNRIPILRSVRIRNGGGEVRGAVLTAQVRDLDGLLSRPFDQFVDLSEGGEIHLEDLQLRLDPARMSLVEERRPAIVEVGLSARGEPLASGSVEVDVLAGHQWLARPQGLALEMLSAHVMPNSPEVRRLLDDTRERLTSRTGSPSLEGYQSGPERVDQIVEAVYAAMQARLIRYAEPPASWGDVGQKIRTPFEVLDERIGTCLDLVVVMAACLEQAGIRPLIWVVEGHAFLGYWRAETALDAIATSDIADVANRVELGQMRLVETTALTAREEPIAFSASCRSPYERFLRGDVSAVVGVVDVWTARRSQLLPLPARSRQDDGSVVVVEYRPTEHSAAPQPEFLASARPSGGVKAVQPARVAKWKNTLLDLSLRNKLINFSAKLAVNIGLAAEDLGYVEDLLHSGKPLNLVASDALDDVVQARGIRAGSQLPAETRSQFLRERSSAFIDVTGAAYQTRLRNLAYKARTIVEETGANNLYLALGSLVWTHDRRELRSPLILIPVNLKAVSRQGGYRLELDESGSSTPNFCLLEKLKQTHGISIPGLANPVEDESGIDLDAAFRATRLAMVENGLSFRVEATADIAILQFAKFRLWKDLDEQWDVLEKSPLVRHLAHTPSEPYNPGPSDQIVPEVDLDELAATCPIPADASQLTAVADALRGKTFVLEGPPGTGKSQTITNLLARAMVEGRRVLFVAESALLLTW